MNALRLCYYPLFDRLPPFMVLPYATTPQTMGIIVKRIPSYLRSLVHYSPMLILFMHLCRFLLVPQRFVVYVFGAHTILSLWNWWNNGSRAVWMYNNHDKVCSRMPKHIFGSPLMLLAVHDAILLPLMTMMVVGSDDKGSATNDRGFYIYGGGSPRGWDAAGQRSGRRMPIQLLHIHRFCCRDQSANLVTRTYI